MLYELIGFSRILYDFIWSCLKYGGIFSRLHQYPIGRIDRMLLSCSKFSLRSLSILTKIDNHCTLQDFVQDPVRPCKILYDSTVKYFTECCGVLSCLSKIPYPSHRILYDLIGFSRILQNPVIPGGSCTIEQDLVFYPAGSSSDLIRIPQDLS